VDVALTSVAIVVARMTDVSLGTVRTIFVVRGRTVVAACLGFVEILIWILVVSRVITSLHQPIYAVAYAVGFSGGTFLGMQLESRFVSAEQVVRVFTRAGETLLARLREQQFAVTEFVGSGKGGPISLLFLQTTRRNVGAILREAHAADPMCFCIVDDVRSVSSARTRSPRPGYWQRLVTRK